MVGMFILCYAVGLFALLLLALMDWADGDNPPNIIKNPYREE